MGTTWIGQRAIRFQYGASGEMRWSDVIGPQNVEHRFARRYEIVGNYPSMAPPPDGLSTHYCRCRSMPELTQPSQTGSKLVAHGVVRIIVKALIFPKRIHARRHIPVLAAESPEFGDMLITDFKLGQSLGELRGIVLRVVPGSRNGSNIDDELDLLRS